MATWFQRFWTFFFGIGLCVSYLSSTLQIQWRIIWLALLLPSRRTIENGTPLGMIDARMNSCKFGSKKYTGSQELKRINRELEEKELKWK
ncbi:hypothetical protein PIB30_062394 [Stylosanthes scabra]|uniref:ATP synthase F0 subunit 8 n=1 Tax=Stylosanthes scabra TaxID=79078 RepID=A0ABU6ZJW7_9FABA|nr:hypothetical protein [Stylosanthes scabra]